MNLDLTQLLSDWPYEPGQITARFIQGDDGEPKIQIRLDLGIIQMNSEGRPDGQRPNDFGSILESLEAKLDMWRAGSEQSSEGGESGEKTEDRPEKFVLSQEDCRMLRDEAVQYYHRYVALLVLEEFDGVVRDTTRNLRVLDLCGQYGETESDRTILEQFRPYIIMMRTRAIASQALKENESKAAVLALDEGLDQLRKLFTESGQPQLFDESSEVEVLKSMREALVPKLPVSQKSELRQRLSKAIEQENYELAAILRDELKMIKD